MRRSQAIHTPKGRPRVASVHHLREHLVGEIERLADEPNTIEAQERVRPDSLEAFIGGIDAEPISGDIDEIVYGV